MAQYSILNKLELPKWAWPFRKQLAANQKSLYFYPPAAKKALKVGLREEKRTAIRNTYFNPAEPSTIQPITDKLRDRFANLPKKEVRNTLMTFPTYQKNFGRRLPPKVLGKMVLTQPGILACDMFFPSPKLGWKKINCLTVMDCWSRFTRCYAMDRKNYESTEKALSTFCKEFAALGHLPRRMLCDKECWRSFQIISVVIVILCNWQLFGYSVNCRAPLGRESFCFAGHLLFPSHS